ncbi:hypothetical protein CGLO_04636 [Colletotrichum gloeosporioides Cg-14]|uniref:Uncharacterized protein n=1 Tax=Colletotrichum gloeosporioides (strain Cg-14) TaxID=1237896 RepID=T0M3Y3_COLGC|nr:hypothetical protein CGLO_04636 [Colletotrichum gloeosporioides Cg-14]
MAYPFSEEEKRLILAEVIKTSNLDLGHLVDFLKLHKTEPNWLKMQLPPGRTMEQCIQVTEQMFQGPMRIPDLKRKPVAAATGFCFTRTVCLRESDVSETDERWPREWHGVQRLSEPKPAARSAAPAS